MESLKYVTDDPETYSSEIEADPISSLLFQAGQSWNNN